MEVRDGWTKATGDLAGKNVCDTYGAEHLARLLGKLKSKLEVTQF